MARYMLPVEVLLNKLSVGDTVIMRHQETIMTYRAHKNKVVIIGKVSRITKTQFVANGIRFNKRYGEEVGDTR